jgi:Ca2+-binding EF-hand superfamily protein
MKLARTVLAASMALGCALAFAGDAHARQGFNDMDKDADGRLTRAEAAGNKNLLERWDRADANHDGVLTRSEYLDALARRQDRRQASQEDKKPSGFNGMDNNVDGKLSRAEAAGNAALRERWDEFDANKDGSLSREEYLRWAVGHDIARARARVGGETTQASRPADASAGGTAPARQVGTPHK